MESKYLTDHQFLAGDQVTIADVYAITEITFHEVLRF